RSKSRKHEPSLRPPLFDRAVNDLFFPARDLIKRFLLQLEATQAITVHQSGIEADLVWQLKENFFLRRMAEQHSVRQVMTVHNELIADPKQFLFVLVLERLRWVHARVNAQIMVGDIVRSQGF